MVLKAPLNTTLIKIDDGHLVYTNTFGIVSYRGDDYSIDRVDILSPSVHMVR